MDVVIIGGGAAGMAAAIAAAECGDQVTVLERMDRVGKKLLATGNGRCNLMNTGEKRYPGGAAFAGAVLDQCGVEEQRLFWQSHGLRMREEEGGRVYPVSGQATTVLDVLRLGMEQSGVQVRTGIHVNEIRKKGARWQVKGDAEGWLADRVIVCGGGCAQEKLGSDGSCYPLLEKLGHGMVPVRPALTQVETESAPIRGLSGIRVRCECAAVVRGKCVHRETGEALFTDYGVSGVCVMQCARYLQRDSEIVLNLLPALGFGSARDARTELERRARMWPNQAAENLLTGLCVPRLALAIGKAAGVLFRGRTLCELRAREMEAIAETMEAFALPVRGVKGFETAQVTSGGIDTADFDPLKLESRLARGVHAAGEVLHVDGDCGGFNLMFAFGSGLLAGLNGRRAPWEKEQRKEVEA